MTVSLDIMYVRGYKKQNVINLSFTHDLKSRFLHNIGKISKYLH